MISTNPAKLAWAPLAERLASDVAHLAVRMERPGTNDSIDLNDLAPELRRLTEIASHIEIEAVDRRLRDFVDETLREYSEMLVRDFVDFVNETLRNDSETFPELYDWPVVIARFRALVALLDQIDQLADGEAG